MSHVVQIVHAAYRLDGDDEGWLNELVEMMAPRFERGRGMVGFRWRVDQGRVIPLEFVTCKGREGDEAMFRTLLQNLDPTRARLAYEQPYCYRSLSEIAQAHPVLHDLRDDSDMQHLAHQRDVIDFEMLRVDEARCQGWMFSVMRSEVAGLEPARRALWECVAAHIAAGARLRQRLDRADLDGAAAIYDPVTDRLDIRENTLKLGSRRETLRSMIAARRQADALAEHRPLEAMALWQGLVAARWSLLDVLDSDGRAYTILRENPVEVRSIVGLSERERQVAYLVGRGHHTKLVAYELGLSPSTVRTQLRSAMRKLNVEGRAGLIRLVSAVFEAQGPVPIEDTSLLALANRPCHLPLGLSEAERDVARQVYDGLSNEDIAARRATSSRTVANQLRAIYAKLGINSREELIARLSGDSR
ncbi:helix-turn-helix transcriptional regulator [Bradymonas sediminis]|uniref:Uncharacterized protein n=1 Tax=Bradymonas sediminis TaxID=1548548 RepID=A0A2Z4FL80_9DELT|nr:LuxR family transcriptional regulator [Bradymonas sediminis]AWV89761.1 hypothetical protein DN745_10590 [Bradymonas sediminis]TDP76492.1 regulatory LuxR family protein [Bradymonas sediminis]